MIDEPREAVYRWLAKPKRRDKFVWNKVEDLLSCTWCVGWWVSVLVYMAYARDWYGWVSFLSIAAIAGGQGLLHALEPSDD